MSNTHHEITYSIKKVWFWLFVFTMIEVAWGMWVRDFGRPLLWGGLLACAVIKGVLILMYFMNMKWEKMIIWGMILPTVPLIFIVLLALMPDVSNNRNLDHPIGSMVDLETGEVRGMFEVSGDAEHGDGEHGDGDGH